MTLGKQRDYPPRRDGWLSAMVWATLAFTAGISVFAFLDDELSIGGAIVASAICLTIGFVLAVFWFGIRYECTDSELVIHMGFLYKKSIPYTKIRRLTTVKSIMSSTATSSWRIEVGYGKFDSTEISPLDHEGFLEQMKEACPQAVVERKAF